MDEIGRSARTVRVDPQISTCTVIPADLVSIQVSGGRPPLIAAPRRPQGDKLRGAMENLSDAPLERRVVAEMPVSQPKTSGELTRVPAPDNPCNGSGRRLTYLAGLHVASLACAGRPTLTLRPPDCGHFSRTKITGPAAKRGRNSRTTAVKTHERSHARHARGGGPAGGGGPGRRSPGGQSGRALRSGRGGLSRCGPWPSGCRRGRRRRPAACGYLTGVHPFSGIRAIAARTLEFFGTVTEKCAPCRTAVLITAEL
jgi:hypothetical protein